MGGLCLIAGLLIAPLGDEITLRWTHSIQKTLWEEDYRRAPAGLRLTAARVRGTGAGMEPPPDAQLRDGAWHYTPTLPPLPRLALRHSPHTAPYQVCTPTGCQAIDTLLPGLPADTVVELAPCE